MILTLAARLVKWLARRMGPRRLMALALLLIALGGAAAELATRIRGLDSWLLLSMAFAGLLVGWVFAALPLREWLAGVLIGVLGFAGVLVRVGRLGGALVALLRSAFVLAWEAFRWLNYGPAPDFGLTVLALEDLWADVSALWARVVAWATALAAGEPAFDPVATALVWSLAVWAVGAWAGWVVRRRSLPLLALVPTGALTAIALSYLGGGYGVLLTLLAAVLLLLACLSYDTEMNRWQTTGIPAAELGAETAAVAVVLSVVLVGAAGVSPWVSMQRVVEYVRRLGEQRAAGEGAAAPVGVDQPYPFSERDALDDLRTVGMPRRHLVGSGPELSEQVVMLVSTGDLPPGPPDVVAQHRPPPRYYWRSHTYDRYAYYGWYVGRTETIAYAAGEAVVTATLPTQRTVRQGVVMLGDSGGLLHAAGELVAADQEYRVAWRSPDDAFAAMIEASQYRVDSLVSEVSEAQLRSAGSDYPQWVTERYLALPDTLPERVLALARDLTATEPTPYDRARAIEAYLRQIPYSLDVPEPPRDSSTDVVDYFLFDLQEGYCDYYATAMVVLARAAGLPGRLAVGYASGHYNSFNAHYVVTEADAHAWVEIYFPGYGWIDFEPTGGLPPIERPGESSPFEWPGPEGALRPAGADQGGLGQRWWLVLLGGLALLALAGVVWLAAEGWWLRRLEPAAAVAALYRRLRRSGRKLAVPMRPGDTPYEFVATFVEWAEDLARKGRWGRAVAPAVGEVRHLADLYVQASYTPRRPGADERARAMKAWRRLRWRLWLARMRQRRGLRRTP